MSLKYFLLLIICCLALYIFSIRKEYKKTDEKESIETDTKTREFMTTTDQIVLGIL